MDDLKSIKFNFNKKRLLKATALVVIGAFLFNMVFIDIGWARPHAYLRATAAGDDARVESELLASIRTERRIWVAKAKTNLELLARHNAQILLRPSGGYLISPELAKKGNELLLKKKIRHEDVELLMQNEERKHPAEYERLQQEIVNNEVIVHAYYNQLSGRQKALIAQNTLEALINYTITRYNLKRQKGKTKEDQARAILFNDIIACGFELLLIPTEDKVKPETVLTEPEIEFMNLMRPILEAKDSHGRYINFSQEFFDIDKRTKLVRKLQIDIEKRFYRVASSNIEDELGRRRGPLSKERNKFKEWINEKLTRLGIKAEYSQLIGDALSRLKKGSLDKLVSEGLLTMTQEQKILDLERFNVDVFTEEIKKNIELYEQNKLTKKQVELLLSRLISWDRFDKMVKTYNVSISDAMFAIKKHKHPEAWLKEATEEAGRLSRVYNVSISDAMFAIKKQKHPEAWLKKATEEARRLSRVYNVLISDAMCVMKGQKYPEAWVVEVKRISKKYNVSFQEAALTLVEFKRIDREEILRYLKRMVGQSVKMNEILKNVTLETVKSEDEMRKIINDLVRKGIPIIWESIDKVVLVESNKSGFIASRNKLKKIARCPELADEMGKDLAATQNFILYAEEILDNGGVIDIEEVLRALYVNSKLGKIFIFAKDLGKARVLEKLVNDIDLEIETITITKETLRKEFHPKGDISEVEEIKALIEFAKRNEVEPEDILSVVKGIAEDLAALKELSVQSGIPPILLFKASAGENNLYSLASGFELIVSGQKGLIFLTPLSITQNIEQEIEEYNDSLEFYSAS